MRTARPNQCARLIANAIIYCNSAILLRLLTKFETSGNAKTLALITQISPAAWRQLLLSGHYTFLGNGKVIDLDALVAVLELGWRNFLGFRLTPPSRCSGAIRSRCQRLLREASYSYWAGRMVVEGP